MSKADEVIKRLEEENRVHTITLLDKGKNKEKGFYIIINSQKVYCDNEGYHGIKKSTLALLDEAEIKYKVVK